MLYNNAQSCYNDTGQGWRSQNTGGLLKIITAIKLFETIQITRSCWILAKLTVCVLFITIFPQNNLHSL